jgi:hypothetical protein
VWLFAALPTGRRGTVTTSAADQPAKLTWADLTQSPAPGGIRLAGRCPECGHPMSVTIPYGVLGGTRKGALTRSDDTPANGEWATVMCRCNEPDREGKRGCGAHGYVWLHT